MKQMLFWLAFAGMVCAMGLWPARPHDAAELLPARALVIDAQAGAVHVSSDCGAAGTGSSLDEALSDMQRRASGQLFLDTAEQIVVCSRAWYLLPQVAVSRQLRPAAPRCRGVGGTPDAGELVDFLQAHPPGLTLAHTYAALLAGERVDAPVLHAAEGRLLLAR